MARPNCWEVKGCGRAPGGSKVEELGVCAAATATSSEGLNRGTSGGRICWALAGTLCGGKVQGSFATKIDNCMTCDFFKAVLAEEGGAFLLFKPTPPRR